VKLAKKERIGSRRNGSRYAPQLAVEKIAP